MALLAVIRLDGLAAAAKPARLTLMDDRPLLAVIKLDRLVGGAVADESAACRLAADAAEVAWEAFRDAGAVEVLEQRDGHPP